MFTSGDTLTWEDVQRTSAHGLRIISQSYSAVLARQETASVTHVLQNVAVGVVFLYSCPAFMVKIACKTIPPTYRGSVHENGHQNPQDGSRRPLNESDDAIGNREADKQEKVGHESRFASISDGLGSTPPYLTRGKAPYYQGSYNNRGLPKNARDGRHDSNPPNCVFTCLIMRTSVTHPGTLAPPSSYSQLGRTPAYRLQGNHPAFVSRSAAQKAWNVCRIANKVVVVLKLPI